MRSDYHDRRARRIDRLENRAEKAQAESASRHAAASQIADMIPLGQPILVGHHSERRHRRDLDKIHTNMRKGIDASRKAERLRERAEAARENTAISSDNPDALELLREKLEALEAERERRKAANKAARKARQTAPYPSYSLTNLGARIRATRARLEDLEHQRRKAESCPVEEVGTGTAPTTTGSTTWRVVANHEENRVQVFFAGRPAKEVCRKLRSFGFRWAPSEGAWQRHLTGCAPSVAASYVRLSTGEGDLS